jgi:hypothetical protein
MAAMNLSTELRQQQKILVSSRSIPSRGEVALGVYKPTFVGNLQVRPIYFDPEIDILYMENCRKSDMPQLHLLIVTYVPPFA